MSLQFRLAIASLALAACASVPTIDVTPIGHAPHELKPRAIDSVQILEVEPPTGAISVYVIKASGGESDQRQAAVRENAARLGCDGVVINEVAAHVVASDSTGELTDHREETAAYVRGVCVVATAGSL